MSNDVDRSTFFNDLLIELHSQSFDEARQAYVILKEKIEKLDLFRESDLQLSFSQDELVQKNNNYEPFASSVTTPGKNEELLADDSAAHFSGQAEENDDEWVSPPLGFDLVGTEESDAIEEMDHLESKKTPDSIRVYSTIEENINDQERTAKGEKVLGVLSTSTIKIEYSPSEVLGRGSISTVLNGLLYADDAESPILSNRFRFPVALKKTRLPCSLRALHSLQVMLDPHFSSLTLPNLLKTFYIEIEKLDTSDTGSPTILLNSVLPRATEGSLFDWLLKKERLTNEELQQVAKAMLYSLDAIHSCGVVHNDVKPQNILIFRDQEDGCKRYHENIHSSMLKLADFTSLSTASSPRIIFEMLKNTVSDRNVLLETQSSNIPLGTGIYMSPEGCLGCADSCGNDLWSLGITLFQLATGHVPWTNIEAANPFMILNGFRTKFLKGLLFPFHGEKTPSISVVNNCEGNDKPCGTFQSDDTFGPILDEIENSSLYSKDFCSFVIACLSENLMDRPTAKSLLAHPFLACCS